MAMYERPSKDFETLEAYQCNHCSEAIEGLGNMVEHLKTCVYNPDNKRCMMCRHIKQYAFTTMDKQKMMVKFKCGKTNFILADHELNTPQSCFELTQETEIPVEKSKEYDKLELKIAKKAIKEGKKYDKYLEDTEEFRHSMNMHKDYAKDPEKFREMMGLNEEEKLEN